MCRSVEFILVSINIVLQEDIGLRVHLFINVLAEQAQYQPKKTERQRTERRDFQPMRIRPLERRTGGSEDLIVDSRNLCDGCAPQWEGSEERCCSVAACAGLHSCLWDGGCSSSALSIGEDGDIDRLGEGATCIARDTGQTARDAEIVLVDAELCECDAEILSPAW